MATLKDQMLKAGLVSKKDAKRAAHSQRVETKQAGREEIERRAAQERAALALQVERQREEDRRLAAQRKAEQDSREQALQAALRTAAQIDAALREGRIEHWEGNRSYYFIAQGQEIEFLGVSDDAARRLAEGKAAIVRTGDPRAPYTLLLAGAAQRLKELAPERVMVLHS
jgi:hypothetical protein